MRHRSVIVNKPVAMPSKSESTLMGLRCSAGMVGYTLWASWNTVSAAGTRGNIAFNKSVLEGKHWI